MTFAWLLCGAFGAFAGTLFWLLLSERKLSIAALAEQRSQYESQIEFLRREKDLLLRTALDAKGVQVIDPSQGPSVRNAEVIGRRTVRERVKEGLDRLAEADRKAAAKREADRAEQLEELRRRAEALGPGDTGAAPS